MDADIDPLVKSANKIVVLQANNPDADSLGSALALEQILAEMNKQVSLFCQIDMPQYLRYLTGWSRVSKDMPNDFDLAIIVDASTTSLFEDDNGQSNTIGKLKSKPLIVLDHHSSVQNQIDFAAASLIDIEVSSTGELIYRLAQASSWPLDEVSGEALMAAILGDTQGLSNQLTQPSTYRAMAELTELGVDKQQLEERRRQASKMPPQIYAYKADLIKRTEHFADHQIACVEVTQQEINDYSPLYNPAALVQNDMLQVTDTRLAIVFKTYDSGRVTAAIRSNFGAPIAGALAEFMGGGGHDYAAGFKIEDGRQFKDIKKACLDKSRELLKEI